MNKTISRVLHCLLQKNPYPLNRSLAGSHIIFQKEDGRKYYNHENSYHKQYFDYSVGVSIGFVAGVTFLKKTEDKKKITKFGSIRPDLPFYKVNDVAKHTTKAERVWVTYKQGVYDITDFVDNHPGGDVIMIGAGASVDPFWNLYGVHKQNHILELLESFRIGNLDKEDAEHEGTDDPYAWEPKRHPVLKPSSEKPFNAEPPPKFLVENHLTPQELFYVRNHLPVPDVDPETYELEITGIGIKTTSFTLNDLKKIPRHTVTATIMCAGNRRSEMSEVKPVKGLSWGQAAIGNAEWTGVKLSDLLKQLGVTENSSALHVQFEGLDTDVQNNPYGASIPLSNALDPKYEVLVAYEMNGQPLTRDHGFPVRAIVPGIVGARNVKWLSRIIVSDSESDSHWQKSDYKGFSPSVDWDTVDFSKSPAIQELPVISAICSPAEGEKVSLNEDNTINVKGYAWSGGGRGIVRVDITCDKGVTWHTADLLVEKEPKPGQRIWDWTLWEAKIPLPKDAKKEIEIYVKAVDSSYNTQPENFSNIWNLRGVLNNAYHRIKIKISN